MSYGLVKAGIMTADENLSAAQFFHGTSAKLGPGDLIEPGRPHNFSHLEGSPHVFFTPHAESAKWYAMIASDMEDGHTYQVEPTGHHELDPEGISSFAPPSLQGSRMSRQPLRVVRELERDREAG